MTVVLPPGKPHPGRMSRKDTLDMTIRITLDSRDFIDEIAVRRGRSRGSVLRAMLAVARDHPEEIEACLP